MNWTATIKAAALATALSAVSLAATAEVKIALDTAPDLEGSGTYVWANTFGNYLNEHGMEAKEYPRGALGEEAEKLDQTSQGLLEVNMADVKSAGKLDTLIYGVYLPYLFEDIGHLDMAVDKGRILEKVNAATTPEGVRVLDIVALGSGAGIFNTKKPITHPDDMADLRMRALDETQIKLFESWGTKGTIVSWSEVPNALQTGVADGYMNPAFVPLMFGHTDFIKHYTNANMVPSTRLAIASEDWYQGLSDADRKIVDDAVKAAHDANRAWLKRTEPAMEGKLKEAGIEVTHLTPEARAEFVDRSRKVYTDGVLAPEQVEIWVEAADGAKM
ncbi:TRAP transporter substrate-binding protein [Marinibaculum pumilum]|uniref:TRAP transporter substrate-binding protein n=1 Tax=Marinibaculum pumilum TaxID=1766165 RepID=A0ABV7L1W4_9PROT